MKKDRVYIFDTTLRDGEQALASSLSVVEKIQIAKQLERMRVDIIEAGFPVSSPGDFHSVQTIAKEIKNCTVAGLARAVEKDIRAAYEAVKLAKSPRIHTFLGTSKLHREKKLRKDQDSILEMAVGAVKLARKLCDNVEFSCEDTGRTEPDFLFRIVEAVIKAGASTVNLPDTVGYTVPTEFHRIIKSVFDNVPNIDKAIISVHCHNDLGMAVANSLTAVGCGVRQIECTVNGIGERAGNCSMEEVVMAMKVRKELLRVDTNIDTKEIMRSSRLVSRLCNMPVQPNKAIVGANAFAHSSGIHQDGVLKEKSTYEIMRPSDIGLPENQLNLTSRSGRHVIKHRLEKLGYGEKHYDLDKIYAKFLVLADKKGSVYDDDLEALVVLDDAASEDLYSIEYLNVTSGTKVIPTATITIRSDKVSIKEASTGDGPVDAVCKAIDRATGLSATMTDYRISSNTGGKEAVGCVNIIAQYEGYRLHGTGVSTDIVEASALAYLNIINKISRIIKVKKIKRNK